MLTAVPLAEARGLRAAYVMQVKILEDGVVEFAGSDTCIYTMCKFESHDDFVKQASQWLHSVLQRREPRFTETVRQPQSSFGYCRLRKGTGFIFSFLFYSNLSIPIVSEGCRVPTWALGRA